MNDTDLEDLLALYALGLLEEADRAQLGHYLSQIPDGEIDLGGELQDTREAAALLSYDTDPLDPSPDLRWKLWDRIHRDQAPASRLTAIRFQDLNWQPHPIPGVEIAILQIDQQRRESTALFRAAGPVDYPVHDHKGPEDILMIRGELEVGPITLGPGDFIRTDIGAFHPHRTQAGCLCFVRSCLEDIFLETKAPLGPEAHFPFVLTLNRDRIWQPYATAGIEIAILCQDPDRQEVIGILRADPQVHYPLHQHGGIEELLILSGDLIVEEQVFGPGDYLRSPTGSAHAPWTELGCCFLFKTSRQDRFLSA